MISKYSLIPVYNNEITDHQRWTAAYFQGTKIEACTFLTVNTSQVALLRGPMLSLVKTSVKSERVESLRSIGIVSVRS